jgi:hypothetical protein
MSETRIIKFHRHWHAQRAVLYDEQLDLRSLEDLRLVAGERSFATAWSRVSTYFGTCLRLVACAYLCTVLVE